MNQKSVIIYLLLLFTFNCKTNTDFPIDSNEEEHFYFPIQLGNSWTFDYAYYDTVRKHIEVTYTITKKIVIDGKEYFAFDVWPEFIYFPLVSYYKLDSLFIRNDINGDVLLRLGNKEFYLTKFEASLFLQPNDILELTDEYSGSKQIWRYFVVDTSLSAETASKKITDGFKITYLLNAPGSYRDVIYFPDYGIIRMSYIAWIGN